jgi:hypothetical protein
MLREPSYGHFLRADSDSIPILMASSRISRANFLISSAERCWASIFSRAEVQRQYEVDAKVETSFAARGGISRCRWDD